MQRQFNFFNRVEVKDPADDTKSPEVFKSIEPNVASSGRGHMVVADRLGQVQVIDKGLQAEIFVAYKGGRVTHLKQLKQRNILVTVGEEDNTEQSIKLWNFDKPDRNKPGPTLERLIRVNQTGNAFPVTVLAVLENLSQIAVGLANGTVVLISGDLMRERTTAQRIVHQNDEPIT
ncbi:Vacuolar protein sorting-associated protein 11, partial [Modicella reniformis]